MYNIKIFCNIMNNYKCRPCEGIGNQLYIIINTMSHAYKEKSYFSLNFTHGHLYDGYGNKRYDNKQFILTNLLNKIKEGKNDMYVKKINVKSVTNINDICMHTLYKSSYIQHIFPEKLILYEVLKDAGIYEYQENIKEKYDYLVKDYITISLHIRHTDFKKMGWVLKSNYYIEGINKLKEKLHDKSNLKFLCFFHIKEQSVIELIDELENIFSNDKFECIDSNIPPDDQLMIQSICHHNIVANSTYSLWGAIINKSESSIIVYPNGGVANHKQDVLSSKNKENVILI